MDFGQQYAIKGQEAGGEGMPTYLCFALSVTGAHLPTAHHSPKDTCITVLVRQQRIRCPALIGQRWALPKVYAPRTSGEAAEVWEAVCVVTGSEIAHAKQTLFATRTDRIVLHVLNQFQILTQLAQSRISKVINSFHA